MKLWFVNYGNPWFIRGGRADMGSESGAFTFSNTNGHANGDVSFRVVFLYYDFNIMKKIII